MDEVFPGYSKMDPKARSVYFLRDGLDPNAASDKLKAGYQQMVNYGADMSQYDNDGINRNDKPVKIDHCSLVVKFLKYRGY